MKTGFLFVLASAAVMAALSGPTSATTVDVSFKIKITNGTSPSGLSATGQTFDGVLSYDDSDLLPGASFSRSPLEGDLTMVLPFLDRTLTEADSDLDYEPLAEFAADGSLLELHFGVDVPYAFFFSFTGTEFSYEYSKRVINDPNGQPEQVGIGGGAGVLNPASDPVDPAPVPLPATAPLLLAALLGGMVLRRRR